MTTENEIYFVSEVYLYYAGDVKKARKWLEKPNKWFGGKTPLQASNDPVNSKVAKEILDELLDNEEL